MLDVVREVEEAQRRMRNKEERDFERFVAASDQRARDRFLRYQEQQIWEQRHGDPMAIFKTLAWIVLALVAAVRFVFLSLTGRKAPL
jgi:hypothetical protein